eukprot:scaffold274003_cov14-Tisochrysis_lutea.AAC.1
MTEGKCHARMGAGKENLKAKGAATKFRLPGFGITVFNSVLKSGWQLVDLRTSIVGVWRRDTWCLGLRYPSFLD